MIKTCYINVVVPRSKLSLTHFLRISFPQFPHVALLSLLSHMNLTEGSTGNRNIERKYSFALKCVCKRLYKLFIRDVSNDSGAKLSSTLPWRQLLV